MAHLLLLADAGEILVSSLEYDETCRSIARLVVPAIADWCAIQLSGGGGIHTVEVAHADPAKVELARQLTRGDPPHPIDQAAVAEVIRAGTPKLHRRIPDKLLRETARSEDELRMARELGLRSAMIVPLHARGQNLGALTLVSGDSDRRYGPDDLALAEALASRAALAVDNARQYRVVREAETRYHLLFERNPLPMWVYDRETLAFLAVNDAAVREYGYSREEFQRLTIKDIRPPEEVSDLLENIAQVAPGFAAPQVWRHRRKNGELMLVSISADDLEYAGRRARLVLAQDVTQRERAEHALRESEQRFRATFEQAAAGIGHVAIDGRWLRVNERLCQITGYTREELLRLTFQDITHPDDLRADVDLVRRLLAGEIQTYSLEKRYVRKDGSIVWIEATVALARRADGAPDYFISIVEDITERRRAAAERERLLDRERAARAAAEEARREASALAASLEQANLELRRLAETAAAASRAKSEFLAVMSHELRTPLNAIAGYAQLLDMGIRGPITEAQRQDLKRIQRSQQHLLSVIDGVLAFTKVEVGQMTYQIEEISVSEALVGLELLLAPTVREKRVHLETDEMSCRARVRADPEKLRQILLNLLSNALKFTPAGGRVRLECYQGSEEAIVRVHDTGVGIPADKLESIFEPFMQVNMGLTREHAGTGLGLAISREFARAMGGDISAVSVLGQGSTFSLRLPRAREDAAQTESSALR